MSGHGAPGQDGPAAGSGPTPPGFSASAEEASRLVDALGEWLAARAGASGLGLGSLGAHFSNGSSECRLCPVCQLIGTLRHARPEIVAHLDDAASSLLAALRLALDGADSGRGARSPAGFENIDIR